MQEIDEGDDEGENEGEDHEGEADDTEDLRGEGPYLAHTPSRDAFN